MAPTQASVVIVQGTRDVFGGKSTAVFDYTGPASYANGVAGGDQINAFPISNQLGMGTIDWVDGSVTVDGLYSILAQPAASGRIGTWVLRWVVISTGLEVANAVNLSASKAKLNVQGK